MYVCRQDSRSAPKSHPTEWAARTMKTTTYSLLLDSKENGPVKGHSGSEQQEGLMTNDMFHSRKVSWPCNMFHSRRSDDQWYVPQLEGQLTMQYVPQQEVRWPMICPTAGGQMTNDMSHSRRSDDQWYVPHQEVRWPMICSTSGGQMTNDMFHSWKVFWTKSINAFTVCKEQDNTVNCVGRVQGRGMECIKACTVCKEQDNTVDELCRQSTRKTYGVY